MKQANNTEMDRLLQRHARHWNALASSARHDATDSRSGDGMSEAGGTSAHLDADEMNAYAEGALPSAARSRYAAHLADCDSCRRIVTDLTLVANVAAEESGRTAATQDISPSKSWWSALAALFAPPVLRYAVPALLFIGIVAGVFVATRDKQESQFVARNDEKQAGGLTTQTTPEPAVQAPPGETSGTANTSTTTVPGTSQPGAATNNAPPSDGTSAMNTNANRTSAATKTEGTPAPTNPPSNPSLRDDDRNDQLYQNEPKAAAPPPPAENAQAPASSVAKEEREEEKVERKQNETVATGRTETANVARSKDAQLRDNPSVAGGSTTTTTEQTETPQAGARAATRRRANKSSADQGADRDENLSSSTETRSVGGRRFRRQGNAWVDTAYNSSRSTINVTRGSEQYRALVADEPGLRSIADQLGGEVIVVWKGKAYRIY